VTIGFNPPTLTAIIENNVGTNDDVEKNKSEAEVKETN